MFIGIIILSAVGLLFTIIGCLLWKKEKITLLHEYHYNKVSDDNKPAFCKLSGIGLLVIGLGLLLTAVLLGITDSAASFLVFAAGSIIGVYLLSYAGKNTTAESAGYHL